MGCESGLSTIQNRIILKKTMVKATQVNRMQQDTFSLVVGCSNILRNHPSLPRIDFQEKKTQYVSPV